jgi:hypothetical protein
MKFPMTRRLCVSRRVVNKMRDIKNCARLFANHDIGTSPADWQWPSCFWNAPIFLHLSHVFIPCKRRRGTARLSSAFAGSVGLLDWFLRIGLPRDPLTESQPPIPRGYWIDDGWRNFSTYLFAHWGNPHPLKAQRRARQWQPITAQSVKFTIWVISVRQPICQMTRPFACELMVISKGKSIETLACGRSVPKRVLRNSRTLLVQ